jgi:hypothetical protein
MMPDGPIKMVWGRNKLILGGQDPLIADPIIGRVPKPKSIT